MAGWRTRAGLIVLAAITAVTAAGYAVLARQASRAEENLTAARRQLGAAQVEVVRLQQQIRGATANGTATAPPIPADADEPGLMDELTAAASQARVHIEDVQLGDASSAIVRSTGAAGANGQGASAGAGSAAGTGARTAVTVSLTATGPRAGVLDFIDRLQTGGRWCEVVSVQVTAQSGDAISAHLDLRFPYGG
ncbi:hypothetical protein [Alicyclobacillus sp.]|uniref:hypothetical protein n=1 Tax=Alicyclobacillus sp. TaxID=61169 RepID=UPI0025BDE622|nr:hypothetical protein [Alicyclobacillus sp.]MCL6516147.1 hypothetical protein [Alicyclobacillus sp.]